MNQISTRTLPAATISHEAANALAKMALEAAALIGIDMSVAVVDAGGALRSFARGDGAAPMTADVAIAKAWTSATSGYPTHVWNRIVADPEVGPLTQLPRMMAISGGYPITDNGQTVGAIGLAGGSAEQDLKIAMDALRAAGFPVES
jgi:uncharacterized protein GlcG (DUF336 family)